MRTYDKHVYIYLKEKSRACSTRPQKKIREIDRGYKDRCQIYLYINLSYISTTDADTHCHKDALNTEYAKNFIKSMLLPYARNQNAHAWHRWWQTCHRNAYICPYRQFKTQSNKDEYKNTKHATGALKRDYNACKTIKPLLPKQRKIKVYGHISPDYQGRIRCLLSGGILDLQKYLSWITITNESKGVWVRGFQKPCSFGAKASLS